MFLISIDGACRRNGKPDCVSAGGVYIEKWVDHEMLSAETLSEYELQSTNQRGELIALLKALEYISNTSNDYALIITDSEYIYNTMTKEWFVGWESRGWLTSTMEPVKNSDLWKKIKDTYDKCRGACVDVIFYHIKGHCIPFGKVTANKLLSSDNTCATLKREVEAKYDAVCSTTKADKLEAANELSIKNNGFAFEFERLKQFVVINTLADAIATRCVDATDSLMD